MYINMNVCDYCLNVGDIKKWPDIGTPRASQIEDKHIIES